MQDIRSTLTLLLLFCSGAAAADQIKLRADLWCPYNCQPDSTHPGFMVEITREALASAGHGVDYQLLNWSRALADVREGTIEAVVGAYKSDAPDLIFPPIELAVSQVCFFSDTGRTWTYNGPASLETVSVGVIKDYSYGETIDGYVAKHTRDVHRIQVMAGDDALEKNLRKLVHGRVDVLVEDRFVFDHFLQTHPQPKPVRQVGCDNQQQQVYVGFSPNNPRSAEYADILGKGIDQLRRSGKLRSILSGYGLQDWRRH